MKTIKMSLLSLTLVASFGVAHAQDRQINTDGYLTDTWKNVVKTSTGLCVRTSSYNPAVTYHPQCDATTPKIAEVIPKIADPVQPKNAEPVITQKVTRNFDAEVLFSFDSDRLSNAGKQRLDQLVRDLRATNNVSVNDIVITGHTDPIGTDTYNMRLSERRAHSVHSYLKSGFYDVFNVSGKGESQLKLTTCGDKKTAKSISCNAPNRRVEIIIHANETK